MQQQALRDFAQALRNFFNGTHRRPTWRKAGMHEGFRQVAVKPQSFSNNSIVLTLPLNARNGSVSVFEKEKVLTAPLGQPGTGLKFDGSTTDGGNGQVKSAGSFDAIPSETRPGSTV